MPVLSPDNWSEDCDLATSGVQTEAQPQGMDHKVAKPVMVLWCSGQPPVPGRVLQYVLWLQHGRVAKSPLRTGRSIAILDRKSVV